MCKPFNRLGHWAKFGLCLGLLWSSHARAAQLTPQSEPGRWIIDGSDHYCSVTRTTSDPTPITFSLRNVPGTGNYQLLMISSAWTAVPLGDRQEVDLIVDPAGESFRAEPRAIRDRARDPLVAFLFLPPAFERAFGEGNVVRIARGGETRIHFTYRQADRAVAAMRECIRFTLDRWGYDLSAQQRLGRGPERIASYLSGGDFPRSELRDNLVGGVTVLLSITASGEIEGCRVVAASGHDGFDRVACAKADGPGFYKPALDLSGRPVAAQKIERLSFEIADRP